MQTTKGAKRPGAERKRPDRKPTKQAKPKKAGPQTAQQTIPYRELFKDGICRVNDKLYTKSLEYEDINYQLAQADDQSAIFDGYCAFLNSFDSSLPFQLSFINHRSRPEGQDDACNGQHYVPGEGFDHCKNARFKTGGLGAHLLGDVSHLRVHIVEQTGKV